jgi:hypothetical protein
MARLMRRRGRTAWPLGSCKETFLAPGKSSIRAHVCSPRSTCLDHGHACRRSWATTPSRSINGAVGTRMTRSARLTGGGPATCSHERVRCGRPRCRGCVLPSSCRRWGASRPDPRDRRAPTTSSFARVLPASLPGPLPSALPGPSFRPSIVSSTAGRGMHATYGGSAACQVHPSRGGVHGEPTRPGNTKMKNRLLPMRAVVVRRRQSSGSGASVDVSQKYCLSARVM